MGGGFSKLVCLRVFVCWLVGSLDIHRQVIRPQRCVSLSLARGLPLPSSSSAMWLVLQVWFFDIHGFRHLGQVARWMRFFIRACPSGRCKGSFAETERLKLSENEKERKKDRETEATGRPGWTPSSTSRSARCGWAPSNFLLDLTLAGSTTSGSLYHSSMQPSNARQSATCHNPTPSLTPREAVRSIPVQPHSSESTPPGHRARAPRTSHDSGAGSSTTTCRPRKPRNAPCADWRDRGHAHGSRHS